MYEKLESCPSCGHTKFLNHLICKDYAHSKESFALVKCSQCELVFTNPRPNAINIADYYKSENYISHTNKSNSLINFLYKLVRNYTLSTKHQLIKKHKKGNRILDYGAGTGHFIQYMATHEWQSFAYEPNVNNKLINVIPLSSHKEIQEQDKFDVITAWHVVEHVHELKTTLQLFKKSLKKGGYVFIAVPNINSYDALHYKEYWAAYDVPRHLYHFSKKSFKNLISNVKLNLVKTYPMKFDAYYVSLLSEKYKGNDSMFNAFKVGYQSNLNAHKTGEYSSLIYVLKA